VANIRGLNAEAYSHCITRLEKLWERRADWIIAYRDRHSRGNFTNNFSEVTVRLFKENVLHRQKSYNAASLVDVICTEMESYYRNRLLDFANGRNNSAFLELDKNLQKAAYVTSKDAVTSTESGIYMVPSENGDEIYEVSTVLGCCTCKAGMFHEWINERMNQYLV
jgi:hypothetical protein